MDMIGVQVGGNLAFSATNPFADVAAIAEGPRASQSIAINPADRVQSVSLDDGFDDEAEFGTAVDTGYSYGPFYTNRLLYLDVQAELMVVQFRDALDREVRLQFPPELTLKAYRNTTPQNKTEGTGNDGDAQAQQQLPAPFAKPANDGLDEALSIGTGSRGDAAPVPAVASKGAEPVPGPTAGGTQPASTAPGQIVELVA